MNLYILRHGLAAESAPGGGKDSDRPLTAKGERKLWRITEAMKALGLEFDLILSSPYLRARQTAEVVAEAFDCRRDLQLSQTLTPGGSMKQLVEFLNHLAPPPEDVLLVGHEPYLSELVSLLTSGSSRLAVEFKKGGLCELAVESLKAGRCARLEWLLTPRQMALMA